MKRKAFFICISLFLAASLYGESFRMGTLFAVESFGGEHEDVLETFKEQSNIFPGVYWEVILGKLGFGMTYNVKFDRITDGSTFSGTDKEWLIHWNGSWDFRYHLLEGFFIDPFLQCSFGSAGMVNVISGNMDEYYNNDGLQFLSLFMEVGGGVAIRDDGLHLGIQLDYRFYNSPPPVTDFDPYPLELFQASLFGGFSF